MLDAGLHFLSKPFSKPGELPFNCSIAAHLLLPAELLSKLETVLAGQSSPAVTRTAVQSVELLQSFGHRLLAVEPV